MTIGPKNPIERPEVTRPTSSSRPVKGGQVPTRPEKSDDADAVVEISSRAVDLGGSTGPASASRAEHIAKLTKEIAENRYDLDMKAVADSMMKTAAPDLYDALVAAGELDE